MTDSQESILRDFIKASGLTDPRRFKPYYSHFHPWPLMVVGLNPGGDPEKMVPAAALLRKRGQHDAFDRDHPFHRQVASTLRAALPSAVWRDDDLRMTPQTNVSFIRSPKVSSASRFKRDVLLCRPFFRRMIDLVSPQFILCFSPRAARLTGFALDEGRLLEKQRLPWGARHLTTFVKWQAQRSNGCSVTVLGIPHPAAHVAAALRDKAVERLSQELLRLRPIS